LSDNETLATLPVAGAAEAEPITASIPRAATPNAGNTLDTLRFAITNSYLSGPNSVLSFDQFEDCTRLGLKCQLRSLLLDLDSKQSITKITQFFEYIQNMDNHHEYNQHILDTHSYIELIELIQ
jgi:hypothetical protein